MQLTDRFASEQCLQKKCEDHNQYCGGTWSGTTKMMGYIQQMGFDAVWMSPYTQQGPDSMGSAGYHGKDAPCSNACPGERAGQQRHPFCSNTRDDAQQQQQKHKQQ
jgi:hypothetical protein